PARSPFRARAACLTRIPTQPPPVVRTMARTPSQAEWPTQVREAPTAVIEDGATAPGPPPPVDPRRRALNDVWPWLFGLALLVIAQKPVPGTRVKRGAVVLLSVSRGKPALAVPDLTGQPAPQAVSALRKAGFLPLVVGVPSAQPKGTVVAEAPTAGTKAQAGS